ncbi:MAG: helix-turn-helix transcriptional regulator [Clostridia bacterium]|nr:helix-turn-helix transcriptional regulator [Clostridia bacterium]
MPVIAEYKSKKLIYHHSLSTGSEPEFFTLHTHSVSELMFFVHGSAKQMVEGKMYTLHKNDLVYVKPSVYHRVDPDLSAEYERYVLMFDPEIIKGIDGADIFESTAVVGCARDGVIPEIIKKLDYYCLNFPKESFYELATMLLREIFYNLSVIETPKTGSQSSFSPLLSRAISYINDNLFTIGKVSEISDALYITESYLYSIFREQLRTTPKKYITDKRLLAARKAIMRGARPTEIYREMGFSEYSTFYRSFVSLFGYSPSKKISASAVTIFGENR